MIKIIDELPFVEKDKALKELKKDVMEIITRRIDKCEIVNTKYSTGAFRTRLQTAMREVLWEIAMTEENGERKVPSRDEVFKIVLRNINGEPHWFVTFDVELWERRMKD